MNVLSTQEVKNIAKYSCNKTTTLEFISQNLSRFDNFDVLMRAELTDDFINRHFWYFKGYFDILLRKYQLSERTIKQNLKTIQYFGLMHDVLITQQISQEFITEHFLKKKYVESIVKYQIDLSPKLIINLKRYINESVLFERIDILKLILDNSSNQNEIDKCIIALKNTIKAISKTNIVFDIRTEMELIAILYY
jgi:hypothetical protein